MCRSIGMSVTNRVGVEDANWLLSLAELPHLEKMVPLAGGWDNTNFLLHLADGSKVVLKAWFANRVEEVHRVILRHIHLDSHGIPTTVPIKLYDDRSFVGKTGFAWPLRRNTQGDIFEKALHPRVGLEKNWPECTRYLFRNVFQGNIGWGSHFSIRLHPYPKMGVLMSLLSDFLLLSLVLSRVTCPKKFPLEFYTGICFLTI